MVFTGWYDSCEIGFAAYQRGLEEKPGNLMTRSKHEKLLFDFGDGHGLVINYNLHTCTLVLGGPRWMVGDFDIIIQDVVDSMALLPLENPDMLEALCGGVPWVFTKQMTVRKTILFVSHLDFEKFKSILSPSNTLTKLTSVSGRI